MKGRKLRVVIDIAALGYAEQRKSHARGVHRVAQHIVFGLLKSKQCDLHFVATSRLAGAHRMLTEKGLSPEKMLTYRPGQLALSRWAEKKSRWIEHTLPDRRLHMRGARFFLQRLVEKADAQSRRISLRALRDADIYHSTLSPIPKAVQSRTDIKQFLTIVDVIPLTNPDTVGGKGVPLLKKQLASLTPRSYAFCISETVKNDLLDLGTLPPQQVFVTPLAASGEIFHPITDHLLIKSALEDYAIPDAPYFLTLSSFDPRKNFDHVIRCFARLVDAGELGGCNLVIVGANPERNTQVDKTLTKFPSLRARIFMPGFIPDERLAAIYSGAQAFLFPSLSEGFGIPVLEAMQCGTPVISSNATSLPEVIGQAGILLDPKDIEAWAEAMVRISADPQLRSRLALLGLDRAKQFSWDRFIQATIDGYSTALKISGPTIS